MELKKFLNEHVINRKIIGESFYVEFRARCEMKHSERFIDRALNAIAADEHIADKFNRLNDDWKKEIIIAVGAGFAAGILEDGNAGIIAEVAQAARRAGWRT